MAFLALDLSSGRIHVLHCPIMKLARIGVSNKKPWECNMHFLVGNGGKAPPLFIEAPKTSFEACNLAVPTAKTLTETFSGDPAATSVPSPEGDMHLVRLRKVAFVPPPLAALIMQEPLSPRKAYEALYAEAFCLDALDLLEPTMAWLRACCVSNKRARPSLDLSAITNQPDANIAFAINLCYTDLSPHRRGTEPPPRRPDSPDRRGRDPDSEADPPEEDPPLDPPAPGGNTTDPVPPEPEPPEPEPPIETPEPPTPGVCTRSLSCGLITSWYRYFV